MKNKKRFDKLKFGLLPGILIPIITFFLYYLLSFNDVKFEDYLQHIHEYRILFKIMSLCVLTNLPLFYIYIQYKKLRSAQGVVMAVFFYAFMVLAYRLIF